MLFGKFSSAVSSVAKEKCWGELATAVTAVSDIPRSAADIKKKWSCLKSEAKSAASSTRRDQQKTGGGPKAEDISCHQARIIGIIGEVCVDGVDTAGCQLQDMSGISLLLKHMNFASSDFIATVVCEFLLIMVIKI